MLKVRLKLMKLLNLIRYPRIFGSYYVFFKGRPYTAPSMRQRNILASSLRGDKNSEQTSIIYNLIRANGRINPIILDIGGNIGYVALEYNRLLDKLGHGRCISFEPYSKSCGHFLNNTKLASRVHLFNFGLGQKTSFTKFGIPEYVHRIGKDMANTGFYSSKNIPNNTGVFCAVYKLDDISTIFNFNDSPISFVKIDVEGSELDVILGSKATLATHKPCLQIEFNRHTTSENDYKSLFRILTDLGYRCFSLEHFDNLSSIEHYVEPYYIHESEFKQIEFADSLMHRVAHL